MKRRMNKYAVLIIVMICTLHLTYADENMKTNKPNIIVLLVDDAVMPILELREVRI